MQVGPTVPREGSGSMKPVPLCLSLVLLIQLPASACAAPGGIGSARPASVELRLPADIVYRRVIGADRAVVFSHQTHVPLAGNRCTTCHPAPFPMLRPGPAPTHRTMKAGGSCEKCHDGKKAFSVRDPASCAICHSGTQPRQMTAASGRQQAPSAFSAPAASPFPKPHPYPRGGDSPGVVTFRHETHLRAAGNCRACHSRLFRMASSPPIPGGGMHEPAACGACHDGTKAFAAADAASCARCHADTGANP
jgi:c(7)-type cytochrome triheme protein